MRRRRPASRASSSTSTCATPACSFRSIPAPTPRSAAWRRRAPRAPTPCATARCARTCSALTVVLADGRVIRTARRAAQIVGRLRPHAALRRLRRHARRHHRGDACASTASPRRSSSAVVRASDASTARSTPSSRRSRSASRSRASSCSTTCRWTRSTATRSSSYPDGADAVLRVPRHRAPASQEQAETVQAIAGEHGGGDFRWATSPRSARSCGRRATTPTTRRKALRPGAEGWATDVCVPISRLAECIAETKKDIDAVLPAGADRRPCRRRQFPSRSSSIDPNDAEEMRGGRARSTSASSMRALAMDGTCTGEHGIGYGKMDFLVAEHGEAVERHAHDQAGARPRQHHEPGQDRPGLMRRALTAARLPYSHAMSERRGVCG